MNFFISYASKYDKKVAGDFKKYLERHEGFNCFVAHDDIKPGTKWEDEVLENLLKADYFLPIQTNGLVESYWCQQEAGIAFNKGIKIIPLIPDTDGVDPVGFYAKYQGFRIKINDLNGSVKRFLIEEGLIESEDHEEIEKRIIIFEASNTWDEASKSVASLLELGDKFSKADILRIVDSTLSNNQIYGSFGAYSPLKRFFMKHAAIIPKDQIEQFLSYQ